MVREQQRLAKQIKRVAILRNDHILTFCAVRKHAHILNAVYTLRPLSHNFNSHFVALACMTDQRSVLATPTNSNLHALRCARGILCEYVHLVARYNYIIAF